MSVDHYENFPVASWLCPARLRDAVRAIYQFARCADDLADEGDAGPQARLHALAEYRSALEDCFDDATSPSAPGPWRQIFDDLRRARRRHALPVQPLRDLLSAFEQDVRHPGYADRTALLDYCSRSAHPVGRLLLHLYGIDDRDSLQRADAICGALQLINFWQDLSVDLRRGRCNVPLADLDRHGLRIDDLKGPDSPRTRTLVGELVAWARGLMMDGAILVHRIPGRAGWELRLVVQGGLRILDHIEAGGFSALSSRPTLGVADVPPMLWASLRMSPKTRELRLNDPA